jgi:uncharacterized phiE125 gp8 family phage protein
MRFVIATEPATEPVSLTEVKNQLRLTSATIADDLSTTQSIAPGSHAVAASYSLKGTGVNVLGYPALVNLVSGTNGTSGTVDVKIQESDTDSDTAYTDWTGGAFTQVTTANDNATYEKEYTGTKTYIRVVATVGTIACEFGVEIIKQVKTRTDDDYLTSLITAARTRAENLCGPIITQAWDGYLDDWPSGDTITIEKLRCTAITSVKYLIEDDTELTTLDSDTYTTDFVSTHARIRLKDGEDWPDDDLELLNPIVIRFTCGYSTVPAALKQAILFLVAHWYSNREAVSNTPLVDVPNTFTDLLVDYRDWGY